MNQLNGDSVPSTKFEYDERVVLIRALTGQVGHNDLGLL